MLGHDAHRQRIAFRDRHVGACRQRIAVGPCDDVVIRGRADNLQRKQLIEWPTRTRRRQGQQCRQRDERADFHDSLSGYVG